MKKGDVHMKQRKWGGGGFAAGLMVLLAVLLSCSIIIGIMFEDDGISSNALNSYYRDGLSTSVEVPTYILDASHMYLKKNDAQEDFGYLTTGTTGPFVHYDYAYTDLAGMVFIDGALYTPESPGSFTGSDHLLNTKIGTCSWGTSSTWNVYEGTIPGKVEMFFPKGAIDVRTKESIGVVVTLTNIKVAMRYHDEPVSGVVLFQDNWFTANYHKNISINGENSSPVGVSYDVKISVWGANNNERLFNTFYDFDGSAIQANGQTLYGDVIINGRRGIDNYTEGIRTLDGITEAHIASDSRLDIVPRNGGYDFVGNAGGNSQNNDTRDAISLMGEANNFNIRWAGFNCGTALGLSLTDINLPKTTAKTFISAQNKDGTYPSGTKVSQETDIKGWRYRYTFPYDYSDSKIYENPTFVSYGTSSVKSLSSTRSFSHIMDKNYDFVIKIPRRSWTYTFDFDTHCPSGHTTSEMSNKQADVTKKAENMSGTVKTPSMPGYKFLGFFDSSGTEYKDEKMMSNKTFYAKWEKNIYHVNFNANGSSNPNHQDGERTQNTTSGTMSQQEMQYNTWTNLSENKFTRTGYTFKGWNTKTDGSGTSYSDRQSVKNLVDYDTDSITLYAQWTKKLGTETITVTDEITGNPVSGVTLKLQKKVNGSWTDITTNTTRSGGMITVNELHWFDYQWVMTGVPTGYRVSSSNATFGITYNKLSAENAVTLYRIRYKVRYSANGSSNPNHETGEFTQNTTAGYMADSEYTYGVAGTLRKNAYTREGYTFKGWNTKSDGTGSSYADEYDNVLNWSSTDGAIVTLYAQWTKKLGTETITIVSEETGNPIANVTMKLQKKVNGIWTDFMTKTTGSNGTVQVSGLHWFDYRWVMTSVPAGYVKSPDTAFRIIYNQLSVVNTIVLYMQHVNITIESVVDCIIEGESLPAFLYHISGNDAAGVKHEYSVMVPVGDEKTGQKQLIHDIFAGTYTITQIPVSRYVPGPAVNVHNATVNGTTAVADVLNNLTAEVRFPYTLTNHGWYYGTDNESNRLRK